MKPRYLTKSRFKLALDCPTKLYYTRNSEYSDSNETDSFLQGLAQGGFQVEELARMYYPEGIAILNDDWNYDLLAQKTQELLQKEKVTIFEAAFLIDGLFIRVDILKKDGNLIDLIEVKAKSVDGSEHESFLTKTGNLSSGMKPYLYDIAFQKFVIQKCHPEFKIKTQMCLVDKSKKTSVSGLNSHFKINPNSDLRTKVDVTSGLTKEDLGDPILTLIPVDTEVDIILNQNPIDSKKSFEDIVFYYRDFYKDKIKIQNQIGSHCKGCEFNSFGENGDRKNGFQECWESELPIEVSKNLTSTEIVEKPKYYSVWYNPAKKAIDDGKYFMDQLTEDDLKIVPSANGMSRSERQWIQIEKVKEGDNSIYVDVDNLRLEMSQWNYPLNFIDFETSAVAIPFTKGMKPYEQLAFQFSHHIIMENGTVEHFSEYINLEVGVFPNFEFLRALKLSLEQNEGSIFRYHNHENTILNVIYNQLKESNEPDKESLMDFIESVSHNTSKNANSWSGNRDMIDLQRTVVANYYHPQTNGSNSIKDILPAVLNSSQFLKEKYTQPISKINLTSKNFDESFQFLKILDGKPINPYKNLPPLFDGFSNEDLEIALEKASHETPQIADGGAALFAYAQLQDPSVDELTRIETKKALLRYCEMDTLAMVMIYEHFKELISH